ncbi:MAG: CapA family protein, partial [Prevotellaceae bacterium]|nr:CapA family protein [Candidatus Faecinaster equi]
MKIFVCGDIINQFSHQQFVGEKLIEIIKSCDYAIGNCEGAVSDGTNTKKMQQTNETPFFLKSAGFDMMLLANNHICDYGQNGLARTIKSLDENGLLHIGAGFDYDEASSVCYQNVCGKVIALINACEAQPGYFCNKTNEFGYSWIGNPSFPELIRHAKANSDYLFVFVHAGLEHYELPLQSFRSLYRSYCDYGADYVIASHPHITQGIENYNNSTIFYSLGNFFFPRFPNAGKSDKENTSFSIIIDTDNHDFDVVYHSMQNLFVEVDEGTDCNVERLSEMLMPENYPTLIKNQNEDAFNKLLMRLYSEALIGLNYSNGFVSRLKSIARMFILALGKMSRTEQHRLQLLKHLGENESYRFLM